MQAPINSKLGDAVGTYQAAFFSFLTGMIVLFVLATVTGGGLGDLGEVPASRPTT